MTETIFGGKKNIYFFLLVWEEFTGAFGALMSAIYSGMVNCWKMVLLGTGTKFQLPVPELVQM